jgi:carbon storage regulator
MLVLSREVDQVIVIVTPEGRRIQMRVVELRGDKVRLGWDADREVSIHRGEVQRRIEKEGQRR